MNKRELIDNVAERTGSTKTIAEAAVNAVFDTIGNTVARGEKVALTGFGSFERADRPARDARNPATGAAIRVPAKFVPTFKAGADFKHRVAAEGARARATN